MFHETQTEGRCAATTTEGQAPGGPDAGRPSHRSQTDSQNAERELFLSIFESPGHFPIGGEQFAQIHDSLQEEFCPQTPTERMQICVLAALYLRLVGMWQMIAVVTASPTPTAEEQEAMQRIERAATRKPIWTRLMDACDSGRAFNCTPSEADQVAPVLGNIALTSLPLQEAVARGKLSPEEAEDELDDAEFLRLGRDIAAIMDVALDVNRTSLVLCSNVPAPPSERGMWRKLLEASSFVTVASSEDMKRVKDLQNRQYSHLKGLALNPEVVNELYQMEERIERSIRQRLHAFRQSRAPEGREGGLRASSWR